MRQYWFNYYVIVIFYNVILSKLRNNEESRNIFIPFIKKMDTFIKNINKQLDSNGEDEQDFGIQLEVSEIFEQVSTFVNEINDNMNENEKETLLNMYNDLVI